VIALARVLHAEVVGAEVAVVADPLTNPRKRNVRIPELVAGMTNPRKGMSESLN
jgi:hypothetical protein